jgi:hypothetical protein
MWVSPLTNFTQIGQEVDLLPVKLSTTVTADFHEIRSPDTAL